MYSQIFFYNIGDESRWSGHKIVGIEPTKDNWHYYIEIIQHSNIRKSQKSYRNAERKYSNIISNCDISNYCLCFAFQNDHLDVCSRLLFVLPFYCINKGMICSYKVQICDFFCRCQYVLTSICKFNFYFKVFLASKIREHKMQLFKNWTKNICCIMQ